MGDDSVKDRQQRQWPGIFAIFAGMCAFAFVQNYRANIPDLEKLDAGGERIIGTVTEFIPAKGHRAAEYLYVFSVEGRPFTGEGTDFKAVKRSNAVLPTVDDQVTVYYLPADPRINRAGSPRSVLRLSYFFEVLLAAATLGCAAVSVCFFRKYFFGKGRS